MSFGNETRPEYDEFKSPLITLWKLTRSEIEHENTLTHHRMTWLFTSQAFLLTVFGVVLVAWIKGDLNVEIKDKLYLAPTILVLISVYGAYICLCVHDALSRAQIQLGALHDHYVRVSKELDGSVLEVPPLQYRDDPAWFNLGRSDSIAVAALIVWGFLLVISSILLWNTEVLAAWGAIISLALIAFAFYRLGVRRGKDSQRKPDSPSAV